MENIMKILPMPEVFAGEKSLNELTNILSKLKASKTLVVTDKGIINAGIYDKVKEILESTKQQIVLFDNVLPDPSIKLVNEVAQLARREKADVVIGLGGGSSIDTAKVAAALVNNDKNINEYIGIDLLENNSLPIIAIPTTAGTGSEVTPIAILSDEEEQLKKGIVSSKIIPQYAILEPALTLGLPPHITAATGMDALTHAIEAYTSVNANEYTDALALKAVKLIGENIKTVYDDGKNSEARTNMLLGSLLAGIAFANAGVAAVHAFAYPLGGMFHIPHGLANSVMLSTIMEYNAVECEEKFKELASVFMNKPKTEVSAQTACEYVNMLCEYLKIPKNLQELKIPEDSIEQMAESVMKITRLLVNNPRKITLDDALKLYKKAYFA